MDNADTYGLEGLAPIKPAIASLVVPQCRITDDLLTRSYNIAALVGRLGNSLSHIVLALDRKSVV